MAKKMLLTIDDSQKKVKQATLTIGGVHKKIKKAFRTVNGVHKLVFSANPSLADLPVGSSVFMNVNGTPTEFLIVQQGSPDATLYDASCDDTWLLMKNVYGTTDVQYGTNNDDFESSNVRAELNKILPTFDAAIQNLIKQVKIPYYNGSGSSGSVASGSNGLLTKLFLLSGYEVGWTTANGDFPVDGAVLDYFEGCAATDPKRIAYYDNGNQAGWWLRSTVTTSSKSAWDTYGGEAWNDNFTTLCAIRPALILPKNTTLDDNFNVIA